MDIMLTDQNKQKTPYLRAVSITQESLKTKITNLTKKRSRKAPYEFLILDSLSNPILSKTMRIEAITIAMNSATPSLMPME